MDSGTEGVPTQQKIIIYQIFTRLFGNKKTINKPFGTIEENGVGKFNDINDVALEKISELGITHIWYTGILEHATLTDYSQYGIPMDDPRVVKGRAGSPYAIKDYFDVCPDLAEDVPNRLNEFRSLIERTHKHNMKVIIDFVPNHVARKYVSDAKPDGVHDLGVHDNTSVGFHHHNNFYYVPGQRFKPPVTSPPGIEETVLEKAPVHIEEPAKATGNNVFSAEPGIYDWFETVKLNYGVDILNNGKTSFDPIPSTWIKMREILEYWTLMGVDGFRCDMAELVPVAFWHWIIEEIKKINPEIIFIAEVYNPQEYHNFIYNGKFDYLYDKVGLYDGLRKLMEGNGNPDCITYCWQHDSNGISKHMLRFLENHDEQRIASEQFAKNPWVAVPAMTVCVTMSTGPAMIYFGQEVGEPAADAEGYSGKDGRTSIFDYWGVPEHQKWMNGGKFDGALLSEEQKRLRAFYQKLLNLVNKEKALYCGSFYELQYCNKHQLSYNYNDKIYSYLRYMDGQAFLIVVNFHLHDGFDTFVKIPEEAWSSMNLPLKNKIILTDVLGGHPSITIDKLSTTDLNSPESGVPVNLQPLSAHIFEISHID